MRKQPYIRAVGRRSNILNAMHSIEADVCASARRNHCTADRTNWESFDCALPIGQRQREAALPLNQKTSASTQLPTAHGQSIMKKWLSLFSWPSPSMFKDSRSQPLEVVFHRMHSSGSRKCYVTSLQPMSVRHGRATNYSITFRQDRKRLR